MPTYEYKCPDCEYVMDIFVPMTAKTAYYCPECGGKTIRQIGAGAAVIFKGSGFYCNDYK